MKLHILGELESIYLVEKSWN